MQRPTILSLAATLGFLAIGVGQERIREEVPGVPRPYWFLYEGNWPIGTVDENSVRQKLPFDELSLEHIGGLSMINYTLTLHRDGRASFDGKSRNREGKLIGEIGVYDFGRLCYLLEKLRFEQMPEDVRSRIDHGSHGYAIVVRARKIGQDKPIVKWEISGNGSIELWAVQASINGVASNLKWTAAGEKNGK